MTTTTPDIQAEAFNARVKPGEWIRYREIKGEGPGKLYKTRAQAYVMSGHSAVVHLHGKSGCVHVDHCDFVQDQEAAAQHAIQELAKAAAEGKPAPIAANTMKARTYQLPPPLYIGGEFRRDGNLIYNLQETGDPRHPYENDVTLNVVAHHLPRETQDAIVDSMVNAANAAFCPSAAKHPADYLLASVKHSNTGDPLVAWWRPEGRGYTTRLSEAGTFTHSEALGHEYSSNATVAIRLSDLGHRMAINSETDPEADGDQYPFTGSNKRFLETLLANSCERRGIKPCL